MGGKESTSLNSYIYNKKNEKNYDEIKIYICGAPKTGKSSLISRMKNKSFESQYNPTQQLESHHFFWNPPNNRNTVIKIFIWECPVHLISNSSSSEKDHTISYHTIFSESDGIIVTYDPDLSSSIRYVQTFIDEISKTPFYSKIPILFISNFLDKRKNISYIPQFLLQHQELNNFITHIQTSFLTNRGLNLLIQWFNQPLFYSSKNIYLKLLSEIQEEIDNSEIQFQNEILAYQDQLKSTYLDDYHEDYSDDVYVQQFIIQQTNSNLQNKEINHIETKFFYNI